MFEIEGAPCTQYAHLAAGCTHFDTCAHSECTSFLSISIIDCIGLNTRTIVHKIRMSYTVCFESEELPERLELMVILGFILAQDKVRNADNGIY